MEKESSFLAQLKLEQKSYNEMLELKRQETYSREPIEKIPVRQYSIKKYPNPMYDNLSLNFRYEYFSPLKEEPGEMHIFGKPSRLQLRMAETAGLQIVDQSTWATRLKQRRMETADRLTQGLINMVDTNGKGIFELEEPAQSSFVTTLEQRRTGLLTGIQNYRDTRYNQHLLNSLLSIITPDPVILPDDKVEENPNVKVLGVYDIILHTDAFKVLCNTPSKIRKYPSRDLILEDEIDQYKYSTKILQHLSGIRSGNPNFVSKNLCSDLEVEKNVVKLVNELKYATIMFGFRATHVQIGPQYKGSLLTRPPTTCGIYLSNPSAYDLFQHPDIQTTKWSILIDALSRMQSLDRSAEDTTNMSFFFPLSRDHQHSIHRPSISQIFKKLPLGKDNEVSDFCIYRKSCKYGGKDTLQLINRFLSSPIRVTSVSIVNVFSQERL